jgi:tetratricopeptide (TPR) repeat protein
MLSIDRMARFEDRTTSWFADGENSDVIAHTHEVERLPRRWPRVLGACIAVAVAAAAVTWMLIGRETRSEAAISVSTPDQAATPAPTKLPLQAPPVEKPADKSLDRSAEWKRENTIGETLLKRNRNGFALERFQRVLAHEPHNERALRGACIALDRLGKRNESADTCRRALRVNPNDLASRRTLARVYYLGGAYSWSAAEWRRVLAAAPKDREARAGLKAAESHRSRNSRSS